MLDVLNKLNYILNNYKYNYKILEDTTSKLSISFEYNQSIDESIYVSILNSLLELSSTKVKISSSNTQPSLSSFFHKYGKNEYIKNHFLKLRDLNSPGIEYVVTIDKSDFIDDTSYNITWFYDLESLIDILKYPIKKISIFSELFHLDKYNIIIILKNQNIFIKNGLLLISSLNEYKSNFLDFSPNYIYNKKIDLRKSCCNVELMLNNIIPDFFIFNFDNTNFKYTDILKNYLNNLFSLFYLTFISNYTTLTPTGLMFKISANKTFSILFNFSSLNKAKCNYTYLIELYYISYNNLNLETIYLIRNMFAIYLCDGCMTTYLDLFFEKSPYVLDSVKENLNIMTIGNVEKYFSIRYSLYDFLDSSTEYVQNVISDITDKMNKTYLSTIAALVGVSFVYLEKGNLIIFKFSIAIYTIFLFIDALYTFTSYFKSFNTFYNNYKNKLEYFRPILGTEKFMEITSKNKITRKLVKRFYWYWSISLIIYSLMIFTGIICVFYTSKIINLIYMIFK